MNRDELIEYKKQLNDFSDKSKKEQMVILEPYCLKGVCIETMSLFDILHSIDTKGAISHMEHDQKAKADSLYDMGKDYDEFRSIINYSLIAYKDKYDEQIKYMEEYAFRMGKSFVSRLTMPNMLKFVPNLVGVRFEKTRAFCDGNITNRVDFKEEKELFLVDFNEFVSYLIEMGYEMKYTNYSDLVKSAYDGNFARDCARIYFPKEKVMEKVLVDK